MKGSKVGRSLGRQQCLFISQRRPEGRPTMNKLYSDITGRVHHSRGICEVAFENERLVDLQ